MSNFRELKALTTKSMNAVQTKQWYVTAFEKDELFELFLQHLPDDVRQEYRQVNVADGFSTRLETL